MGLKRLADARFAPLWILILIAAAVVLAVQLNSDSEPTLPQPVETRPDRVVDTSDSAPVRDRISPLKDGSGT
jgi:hypothetical protein